MTTITELLKEGENALRESLVLSAEGIHARLECEVLLAHLLNISRSVVYAFPEREVALAHVKLFQELIHRRARGEPIAYLVGHKEFYGLDFFVSPAVLVPRPETELLIEALLKNFTSLPTRDILDLGTGSGIIAITLSHHRPSWRITGVDISYEALDVAKKNAKNLKRDSITWIQSDWFKKIPQQQFDLIVSNPPYIAENDPHLIQHGLNFEPQQALTSAEYGMADIKQIITHAKSYLKPGGQLWLEHGYDQGSLVRESLTSAGYFDMETHRDYAAHERFTGASFHG